VEYSEVILTGQTAIPLNFLFIEGILSEFGSKMKKLNKPGT
jgi:hypothetical protein